MGLDTSHDAWHGAYSSFSLWRNALAEAAGYEMDYVRVDPWGTARPEPQGIDWDALCEISPGLYGDWPDGYDIGDPLLYLLAHSDCEGEIHPREGRLLLERLKELLPKLEGKDEVGFARGWTPYGKTEQFIEGLQAAVDAGEDLDFH
jgi:hypothetical protein